VRADRDSRSVNVRDIPRTDGGERRDTNRGCKTMSFFE
jgi:hypothetical protein